MSRLPFLSLPFIVGAWNVARTPPMGFNTWDLYGCGVTAQILMDTAISMNASGLSKLGFIYVNSDDCWALAERDANGNQVANPEKFPDGFKSVSDFIHSLGMKSGLYTAKGPTTCAGFAASCKHEVQDALQWASWGIDYVKDDSCSNCRMNDTLDYMTMASAIEASGREMVLTIEGDPDNAVCTLGGCGSAKRVGHDISPRWMSMVSLVDIGSGLWPFAHNATATGSGWWNDLDILEIGNSPDFNCTQNDAALARCQAHFSMWCIMKAPLLMGNDIPNMSPATLSVLSNAEAIAISQDALGVQARRVAVQTPKNTSLTTSAFDNIAVIGKCSADEPTQQWIFENVSNPVDGLYLEACDASSPFQQWVVEAGGAGLRNVGANACIDASGRSDPGQVLACDATKSSQRWSFNTATGQIHNGPSCLDVFNFKGPDVFFGGCKQPADPSISNQVFQQPDTAGLIRSNDTGASPNSCLAVSSGPPGGIIKTTDAAGNSWCLANTGGAEGLWTGVVCDAHNRGLLFNPTSDGHAWDIGKMNYNNQPGASGPLPHTRYTEGGYSWESGNFFLWLADWSAPHTQIMANNNNSIIDDDSIGHVTLGGAFCVQLSNGGALEVWAGPLSGGRVAVALFNRSPADDIITVRWSDIGLAPGVSVGVRDIWSATTLGPFSSDFNHPVAAHATALLVLTPVA